MKEKYILIILFTAALGIDAVMVQYLFFDDSSYPIINALKMFRYFTLQSNLIVFIYFYLLYSNKFKDNEVFNKLFGGVVIYISTTFIVFLFLIEPYVSFTGFGLLGSIVNHYVTPILVIMYLYKFRRDYSFTFRDFGKWIIYPITYLVFLVTYGVISNDYLYPFFQVEDVGVIGLLLSILGIFVLFTIMLFSLVKIVSKK